MGWIDNSFELSPASRQVYDVLLRHMSFKSGTCCPTEAQIAKAINKSRSSVYKYILELEEKGYIAKKSIIGKGSVYAHNEYTILHWNIKNKQLEPSRPIPMKEVKKPKAKMVVEKPKQIAGAKNKNAIIKDYIKNSG